MTILINNSIPLSDIIEKYVIKNLNKKPYKCYTKIDNNELEYIHNKIYEILNQIIAI